MDNFRFCSPTYFVFGKGTESDAGELVKKYGGTKVLIVYGGGSVVKSGLLERVEKSLAVAGIAYLSKGGVQPNPLSDFVYETLADLKSGKIEYSFDRLLFCVLNKTAGINDYNLPMRVVAIMRTLVAVSLHQTHEYLTVNEILRASE